MKNAIKIGVGALSLVLLSMLCIGVANAQSLEHYDIDYSVGSDNVLVEESMLFNDKVSGDFRLKLPTDSYEVMLYIDNEQVEVQLEKNILLIPLRNARKININYLTTGLAVDGSGFESMILMPVDAEVFTATLTLPDDIALGSTSTEESLSPTSVKVNDTIKIVWEIDDAKKKDNILLHVDYEERTLFAWFFVPFLVILIMAILLYSHRNEDMKKKKSAKKAKASGKNAKPEFADEEQKVLDILGQRGGECNSQILKVITGMKKTDLDNILKKLEKKKKIEFKLSKKKGNGLVKLVK